VDKIARYREAGRRLAAAAQEHPDAVVLWTSISPETFGHFRDLLTVLPSFAPDQPVFAIVHWGRFSKLFRSPATAITARKLVGKLSGVVFLNANRADDCNEWIPPQKRFVIPNTLDRAVLCSDGEVLEKQSGRMNARPTRILFLSHMIREKGYEDLLEATQVLSARKVPVKVTFAGQWLTDTDRVAFETRVREVGLMDRVTHLGPVADRGRIKALHLESDVFVLPSYMIEGQPLAIIEAMNAGSPVVTTDVGGTTGMITSGVEGFLVSKQSPTELADAIEKLTEPERWVGCSKASRKRYQEDYSAESVRAAWISLVADWSQSPNTVATA
jgi:glycosyltransferase involved in cell wall biosynthesis